MSSCIPTAAAPQSVGWGAILTFGDKEKELKGGEPYSTNNRMELMAAISALEALTRPVWSTSTPTASICATASCRGSNSGSATAGAPPTKAGQERRSLAAARGGHGATPRALALGARPCRARPERARRPAGARGARGGALRPADGLRERLNRLARAAFGMRRSISPQPSSVARCP